MQADGGWKTNVCLFHSPASGDTVSMTTQTHHNFAQKGLINKNICRAWLRDVVYFQKKKQTQISWLHKLTINKQLLFLSRNFIQVTWSIRNKSLIKMKMKEINSYIRSSQLFNRSDQNLTSPLPHHVPLKTPLFSALRPRSFSQAYFPSLIIRFESCDEQKEALLNPK